MSTACSSATTLKDQYRVLIIGNSYTFFTREISGDQLVLNNISKVVNTLLGDNYLIDYCTHGGYSIKKHTITEMCKGKLSDVDWDIIILQERTRNLIRNMNASIESMTRIQSWAPSSQYLIFQNWSRFNQPDEHRSLKKQYNKISRKLKLNLITIGDFWQKLDELFPLYSNDGTHASTFGILLSSLVIANGLDQKARFEFSSELEQILIKLESNLQKYGDQFDTKINESSINRMIQKYEKFKLLNT
jgi:hypothetical protein